jgi:hypothetical protein
MGEVSMTLISYRTWQVVLKFRNLAIALLAGMTLLLSGPQAKAALHCIDCGATNFNFYFDFSSPGLSISMSGQLSASNQGGGIYSAEGITGSTVFTVSPSYATQYATFFSNAALSGSTNPNGSTTYYDSFGAVFPTSLGTLSADGTHYTDNGTDTLGTNFNYDNLIYYNGSGQAHLDQYGLLFGDYTSVNSFNAYYGGYSSFPPYGLVYNIYGSNPDPMSTSNLVNPDINSNLGSAYFAPTVPEPSTWAMMLLGFAALGFMAYRPQVKACYAARLSNEHQI